MKRGYVEAAVFVVVAIGAFSLAYWLAQSVGLHPLVVPPQDMREKHWMVAAGAGGGSGGGDRLPFFLLTFQNPTQTPGQGSGKRPPTQGKGGGQAPPDG